MQKTKVTNGGTLEKNDYDLAANNNIRNVAMIPIFIGDMLFEHLIWI